MLPVASLDAAMVIAETPEMPLHTLGVLILDVPEGSEATAYDHLRRLIEARIAGVPPFRRRLVQGPLKLGDLRWIEDPGFDLDAHLLRRQLPAPGTERELAALVGSYAAGLLDREKPLWELMLVEGLAGGRVAVVAKIHHAAMDGGRLVALLGQLFDAAPDAPPSSPAHDSWQPDRLPGTLWFATDTLRTLAHKPRNAAHAVAQIGQSLRRSAAQGAAAPPPEAPPSGPKRTPLGVPRTPWTGALTTKRSVAFADVPMNDLRAVRAAFETTINDVVLAACTAGLRRWLTEHDALPEHPLVANVPVAVRAPEGEAETGNRVSMLRVHLPVQERDPVQRLRLIHAETSVQKRKHRGRGGNVFQHFSDLVLNLTVPWVLTHAVGLYARSHAADFVPAPWNLVISNVPGPTRDLYCGGSRVSRIYPFGPVQHGSGLNLTVLSTPSHMCLGALACRERVPDLEDITQEFVREVGRLLALPGTSRGAPPAADPSGAASLR